MHYDQNVLQKQLKGERSIELTVSETLVCGEVMGQVEPGLQ